MVGAAVRFRATVWGWLVAPFRQRTRLSSMRLPAGTVTYATSCGVVPHAASGSAAATLNSFHAKATTTVPTALPQLLGPAALTKTDCAGVSGTEPLNVCRPRLLTSFCQ